MKTLLFKKSLTDTSCIEITCKRWWATKDGIIALTENGHEFFSCNEFYFWGVK